MLKLGKLTLKKSSGDFYYPIFVAKHSIYYYRNEHKEKVDHQRTSKIKGLEWKYVVVERSVVKKN